MSRGNALTWAIVGLALAAPLAIGGADPIAQVLLSLAALALVGAQLWMVRERALLPVPLMWPAALAVGFTVLQLVPLPSPLVHFLSPVAWELRSDTGGGWLMPLTTDVPATALALARGFACLGLFLLLATHARSHRTARPILIGLAGMGALLAVVTYLQRAAGAEAILGFYKIRSMPGAGFFGTFVDGNHAASVMALSSLIAIGLALDAEGGKRLLFIGCAALTGSVVFFTASRAGAISYGLGGLVLASVALVRRLGWATGMITALALMAVASGATLWMADGLRSRLLPSGPEALYENQKVRGWRDTAQLTAAYRWTGVGRGAFEAPAAAYRQDDEAVRLVYPENLILQLTAERGVPMALLLLGLVGATLLKLVPGLRRRELAVVGAAAGVVAVVVHELADFGLELPGVAFPAVIALGTVVARIERRQDRHQGQHSKRPGLPPRVVALGLGGWALALVGAAWAVPRTLDADFEKVAQAYQRRDEGLQPLLAAAVARHPADDHLELVAAEDALRRKDSTALHHLNRALRLHPANWQAHYLAARTLLGLSRRTQAALEYRLAIERGMAPPVDEILKALDAKIVDAWPQRSEDLVQLAHALVVRHRPLEADEACQRAVAAAALPGPFLIERVQVAMEAKDARTLIPAAQALLDAQPDVDAAALAVRALAQSGNIVATDKALERVLKMHTESSTLMLLGAQLHLDRGDASGARTLLRHAGDNSFSLADRQRAEELLAKIADEAGDVDGAVLARARARLLAHKLSDTAAQP